MADKKVLVYINMNNKDYFIGILWSHFNRGKETSEFEYSRDWLSNPLAFSLEPAMYLGLGKQINPRQTPLFGSFGDSEPDSWGGILMKRYEVQKAKEENRSQKYWIIKSRNRKNGICI